MIGLSAFEDPGLVVLPTHRLVKNLSAERLEVLPLQLERFFHLQILSVPEARAWIKREVPGEKRFAILLPGKAYALTLRDHAWHGRDLSAKLAIIRTGVKPGSAANWGPATYGLCATGTQNNNCGAGGVTCVDCTKSMQGHLCLGGASCGCNGASDCPAGTACDLANHACTGQCGAK